MLTFALYIIGIFPTYIMTNQLDPGTERWAHLVFAIFWPIAMFLSITLGLGFRFFKYMKNKGK